MKKLLSCMLIIAVLIVFVACDGTVDKRLWHTHEYSIRPDGSWRCTKCDTLLAGTDQSYVTLVEDGQPTEIILLSSVTSANVGTGTISVNNGTEVTYSNTDNTQNQDIVFRTNLFSYKLIVSGSNKDTVRHYGYAGLVEVIKVAKSSYDEYGTVGRLSATATGAEGHIDIKSGATVYQIEQLGGNNTNVSVDSKATVYDIEHNKIIGSLSGNNEKFVKGSSETTDSEGNKICGETITASNCQHVDSEDVVDSEHVYEVCKTCGYTVIKIVTGADSNKKTVVAANTNVITPKSTYNNDQITSQTSEENGEVTINSGAQPQESASVATSGTYDDYPQYVPNNYAVKMNGSKYEVVSLNKAEKGSIIGGTFTSKPDKSLISSGYQAIEGYPRDDYYTIVHFTGEGTETDPVSVECAEGLKDLAKIYNSGIYESAEEGVTITLTSDIILPEDSDWAPIGNWEHPFHGTFDGINGQSTFSIKRVSASNKSWKGSIYSTGDSVGYGEVFGFFGIVGGGDVIIQNVNFENVNIAIDEGKNVGAVIGYAPSNSDFKSSSKGGLFAPGVWGNNSSVGTHNVTLKNVTVSGSVSGAAHIGGLIGKVYTSGNLTLINCENKATIQTKGNYTAGLVAYASSGISSITLTSCTNSGNVTNTSTGSGYAGGLLSVSTPKNAPVSLNSCSNTGTITAKYKGNYFGLLQNPSVVFTNCVGLTDNGTPATDSLSFWPGNNGGNSFSYQMNNGSVHHFTGSSWTD